MVEQSGFELPDRFWNFQTTAFSDGFGNSSASERDSFLSLRIVRPKPAEGLFVFRQTADYFLNDALSRSSPRSVGAAAKSA
jgi:hypothetical protein